jgi:hypothetical protein
MSRIVIHAGFHKTGTSTPQAWLGAARGLLRPHAKIVPARGMQALLHACRACSTLPEPLSPAKVAARADAFARGIAGLKGRALILSAEALPGRPPGRPGIDSCAAAPRPPGRADRRPRPAASRAPPCRRSRTATRRRTTSSTSTGRSPTAPRGGTPRQRGCDRPPGPDDRTEEPRAQVHPPHPETPRPDGRAGAPGRCLDGADHHPVSAGLPRRARRKPDRQGAEGRPLAARHDRPAHPWHRAAPQRRRHPRGGRRRHGAAPRRAGRRHRRGTGHRPAAPGPSSISPRAARGSTSRWPAASPAPTGSR